MSFKSYKVSSLDFTMEVLEIRKLRLGKFGESHMGVSKNSGTPKSAILIGFSLINHPFWG